MDCHQREDGLYFQYICLSCVLRQFILTAEPIKVHGVAELKFNQLGGIVLKNDRIRNSNDAVGLGR